MRSITEMPRKGNEIKWTLEDMQSFSKIKATLTQAPVLISPKFEKDFQIYSFSSKHTVAGVLLQKNEEGFDQPIAFYSKTLRDAPLRYNIMEK